MTNLSTVLVIIPSFNEGSRIGKVVNSVKSQFADIQVLVVNDDSNDSTESEARDAGAEVISHPTNLGYGSSLETGYLYALRGNYEYVIQMDGDGQHPASEISKLLEPVLKGEADFTIGSRYLSGAAPYKTGLIKGWGHKVFSVGYSLLTRYHITDPTSGFQCLNRSVIELFTKCRFPEDFPDVDVLLIAHFAGLRMKEVSVSMLERSGGKSMHSGLKPIYYVAKMLLSIFIVILNRRRWKSYVS